MLRRTQGTQTRQDPLESFHWECCDAAYHISAHMSTHGSNHNAQVYAYMCEGMCTDMYRRVRRHGLHWGANLGPTSSVEEFRLHPQKIQVR